MKQPCVYLAGPGVFRVHAAAYGEQLKALAERVGLWAVYPLDGEIGNMLAAHPAPLEVAAAIYRANCRLIDMAQAVVADISPFRGPNMDPGTAFEIGYARAQGKRVFAWSHDRRSLLERTEHNPSDHGRDAAGMAIEDFGLVENLMIAMCVGRIHRTPAAAFAEAADALQAPRRARPGAAVRPAAANLTPLGA